MPRKNGSVWWVYLRIKRLKIKARAGIERQRGRVAHPFRFGGALFLTRTGSGLQKEIRLR